MNLTKFTTKTTTHPKIQEVRTYDVLLCIVKLKNFHNTFFLNKLDTEKELINCRIENITSSYQEVLKRFISPFYLFVLSLIACLIIIKSKDDYKYIKYKFGLFILGVIAIIISEVSINYTSSNIFQNIYLIALPILLFFLVYIYFQIKIKKSNLIT